MMKTVTLPVKGLNFAGCAREIEKRLGNVEPIKQVEASYVSQTVTITYDETRLSETQLREMVHNCGFLCGEPATAFAAPHTAQSHTLAPPDMEHAAHAPAEIAGMKGMEHAVGGMEHDMSNPAMARAMEADMRLRFFVSLVLTIPVVLYSPLGMNLLKLHLPTPFGISPNWVLLVLSTPVVWWGGWIFHAGTWRALRNRTLKKNSLPDKHKDCNKGPVFDFAENTFSATSQTGRSFRDQAPACLRLPEQLMAFPEEVSNSQRDEARQRSPPSCFIRKMQPQNVILCAVATARFL